MKGVEKMKRNRLVTSDKVKEAELLEKAKKYGFYFKRSNAKDWTYDNRLGYAVYEIETDEMCNGFKFELSFEDLEDWFDECEELNTKE